MLSIAGGEGKEAVLFLQALLKDDNQGETWVEEDHQDEHLGKKQQIFPRYTSPGQNWHRGVHQRVLPVCQRVE